MVLINIFRAKEEADKDADGNPRDDAREILAQVNYDILKAAREAYLDIKQSDPSYDPDYETAYEMALPTWAALEKTVELNGDFNAFVEGDLNLLTSLKEGYMMYFDILHLLIDHHNDEDEAAKLFVKYPDLHKSLPEEYDNNLHMMEVLVEVVKDYQWQLEHFYTKYQEAIDMAIADLSSTASEGAV